MLNSNINKALEINSNKAVLLSIKKQWLEKILSGEKTAHQKLLHILANSIVLKLYDR